MRPEAELDAMRAVQRRLASGYVVKVSHSRRRTQLLPRGGPRCRRGAWQRNTAPSILMTPTSLDRAGAHASAVFGAVNACHFSRRTTTQIIIKDETDRRRLRVLGATRVDELLAALVRRRDSDRVFRGRLRFNPALIVGDPHPRSAFPPSRIRRSPRGPHSAGVVCRGATRGTGGR